MFGVSSLKLLIVMLIHIYKCILLGNMPRAKHEVNTDYVGNDQEDIPIAQLRKERRKTWVRTPSPQPMEAEVQDEVEFEGDYGLDVGKNHEQESHDRVYYTDSALDKIG